MVTFRLPQLKQNSLRGSRQTNRVASCLTIETAVPIRIHRPVHRYWAEVFEQNSIGRAVAEVRVTVGCLPPSRWLFTGRENTKPRGWSSPLSASGSGCFVAVGRSGWASLSPGGRAVSTSMSSVGLAAGSTVGGTASFSSLSHRGLNRRLWPFFLGHLANRTRGLGVGSSSSHSATPSEKRSIAGMGSCLNTFSHLAWSTMNHGCQSGLDPRFSTPGSYEGGGVRLRCSSSHGSGEVPAGPLSGNSHRWSPRCISSYETARPGELATPGAPSPPGGSAPRPIQSLPHFHPRARLVVPRSSAPSHLQLLTSPPGMGLETGGRRLSLHPGWVAGEGRWSWCHSRGLPGMVIAAAWWHLALLGPPLFPGPGTRSLAPTVSGEFKERSRWPLSIVFPHPLSNLYTLMAYLAPLSTCANTTDHELPRTRPLLTRPAHTFA